jgi:hypothetical protein
LSEADRYGRRGLRSPERQQEYGDPSSC